jgi:hypothetical protein
MAQMQLTVEPVPAVALIRKLATGCRVDLSFEIHNDSAWELELVAIEQDVYAADGSLLQRRGVEQDTRIGSGEQQTLANPLPELSRGIPLVALVYRFAFRTSTGKLLPVAVRVRAIELTAPTELERTASPAVAATGGENDPVAPTARQLTQAWFETLCGLGVYSLPAPAQQ